MRVIVFSCFTPYHLINSIYYATSLQQAKNLKMVLVWNNKSSRSINLDVFKNCFDTTIDISGFDETNIRRKVVNQSVYMGRFFGLSSIAKAINKYDSVRLVCFSDQDFVTHRLVEYVSGMNDSEIVLVEEGMSTYLTNTEYHFSVLKRIYYKILGIRTEKFIGANMHIKSVIVKHPEDMPVVKTHDRKIIRQNNIFADDNWVKKFNGLIGGIENIVQMHKGKKIILWIGQPLIELGVPDEKELQFLVEINNKFGTEYSIVIKKHPREAEDKYKSILGDNISEVDLGDLFWIPLEFLGTVLCPQIIVTAFSTAALNLLELGIDSNAYFCYKAFGLNVESEFFDKHKEDNICVINSMAEMEQCHKKGISKRICTNMNADIEYLEIFG